MALRPGRGAPEYERQDATELAERALGRRPDAGRGLVGTGRTGPWPSSRTSPARWLRADGAQGGAAVEPQRDARHRKPGDLRGGVAAARACSPGSGTSAWSSRSRSSACWRRGRTGGGCGRCWRSWRPTRRASSCSTCSRGTASRWCRSCCSSRRWAQPPRAACSPRASRRHGGSPSPCVRCWLAVAVNWPLLSATRMRAITETNLGTALHEAGRLDEAVARYEKAVALQPDYAPAYNNLGVTLRAQGQVDAAIAAYERGLALRLGLPGPALQPRQRAARAEPRRRSRRAPEDLAGRANRIRPPATTTSARRWPPRASTSRRSRSSGPRSRWSLASVLAHRNLGNALASMGRRSRGARPRSSAPSRWPRPMRSQLRPRQPAARGRPLRRGRLRASARRWPPTRARRRPSTTSASPSPHRASSARPSALSSRPWRSTRASPTRRRTSPRRSRL